MDASVVYFIQESFTGMVKIGRTTDVQRRLDQLQCGHSQPLRLLDAVRECGYLNENNIHKYLEDSRVMGRPGVKQRSSEFFYPNADLLGMLMEIGKGNLRFVEQSIFERLSCLHRSNGKYVMTYICPATGRREKSHMFDRLGPVEFACQNRSTPTSESYIEAYLESSRTNAIELDPEGFDMKQLGMEICLE